MAVTWYGNLTEVEGAALGSLAVIAPLLQRMGVADIIDRHLPVDPQAEFTHGRLLGLLIAARVSSPVALSNVVEWAGQSGADILWNIAAEKRNDDRLGRSLDAFFNQRHSILSSLALHVAQEFDVPLKDLHYDPTHVLFTGAYENAQPREGVVGTESNSSTESNSGTKCESGTKSNSGTKSRRGAGRTPLVRSDGTLEPAHLTVGRAMDDVPHGTKMIHVGLGVPVDRFGPLPICGHTIDGNQNGRTAVSEPTELLRQHLPTLKLTIISDRGTYSVGHLLRRQDVGCDAIGSVPWGEFREPFDAPRKSLTWKRASDLSIEQPRRRASPGELPHEHDDLAVLKHTLRDDPTGRTIACRVLFVHSTADEKVIRHQRQNPIDRITAEFTSLQQSVAAGRRSTDEAAVTRRAARALGTASAAKYFAWQRLPLTKAEIHQRPQPERGCRPPTHRFEFTFHTALLQADEEYDGDNAIVTTVPPPQSSADELFTRFKQQSDSEQVNSQFQGPLAVRPVFLHSPRRLEALMFRMVIALMLYYPIQHTYRASLPEDAPLQERRITTRTLLDEFRNDTLLIHHHRLGREVSPTRLTAC